MEYLLYTYSVYIELNKNTLKITLTLFVGHGIIAHLLRLANENSSSHDPVFNSIFSKY